MGFLRTFMRLASQCRRHGSWYRDVTCNDPVLGEYRGPDDVVAALSLRSPLEDEERERLVLAIVQAQHESPFALWQGILIQAFAPMLLALRTIEPGSLIARRDPPILLRFADALSQAGEGGDAERIEMRLRRLARVSSFRVVRHRLSEERDETDPLASAVDVGPEGSTDKLTAPTNPILLSLLDEVERSAMRALVRMRNPQASQATIELACARLRRRSRRLWRRRPLPTT